MSYEIGYKKPPKKYQYKKGKSGNYKGRPMKRTRQSGKPVDMIKSISKRLCRKIEINKRGVTRKISVLDAAINKQIQKALADGDQKALAQVSIWQTRFIGRFLRDELRNLCA